MEKQCSELFAKIFHSGSGGSVRKCECGRIWYNSSGGWDWMYGELEELKRNPKATDVDWSVSTINIGGFEVVDGCDCDILKKYEDFILTHAKQIAQYLNMKAVELREKANDIEVNSGKGRNGE